MNLIELFGIGSAPTSEKIIKQIASILSDLSGYRHLAHTRQKYKDNKEYFNMEVAEFKKLQRKSAAGEDVMDDLVKMKKRLAAAKKDWF